MDKFVSKGKMSKKAQKIMNAKDRAFWGMVKPYSKEFASKKAYNRKDKSWKKENF